LNIFIFGNASFKSDIRKVFEHSNIKFRLGDDDSIQEIKTLIELRTAITNYPKDIFLIDDAKIYRKNSLNEKIKFLKPRGAIEEDFIKKHGIEDITVDSLDDLPKYIIEKLEEVNGTDLDDDYHNSRDNSDIQESIIDIVDNAYNDEENNKITDIDEENDKIQLDDELSSLLSGDTNSTDDFEDDDLEVDIEPINEQKVDENLLVKNESEEPKIDEKEENIKEEGEDMSDEFSELDNINESDILAALDGLDDIDINSIAPVKTEAQNSQESQSNIGVEVGNSNVNEIASLITSLLNNKTLEITIKVKA
jgi:hypothetical protein